MTGISGELYLQNAHLCSRRHGPHLWPKGKKEDAYELCETIIPLRFGPHFSNLDDLFPVPSKPLVLTVLPAMRLSEEVSR
jgi:hypothetical protein